ncbi:hypothetical protein HDU93_003184, partial [Gonapodya sp. JEL0774]
IVPPIAPFPAKTSQSPATSSEPNPDCSHTCQYSPGSPVGRANRHSETSRASRNRILCNRQCWSLWTLLVRQNAGRAKGMESKGA